MDKKYEGKDLEAMSFAVNYHRWILKEFSPYIKGKVAEVGAGTGSFTQELLNCVSAKEIRSFEPSREMFEKFKQNINSPNVIAINDFFGSDSNINDGGGYGAFDTVIYVNVMEHVEDDIGEAKKVFDRLNKGGRFLMFVPALQWLYSDFDKSVGHYRRYTKKSARALVEQCGFKVEKLHYFDGLGVIPWFIVFVLFRKMLGQGNVSLYDKAVVPVERILEAIIHPAIGKNLLLVARKE